MTGGVRWIVAGLAAVIVGCGGSESALHVVVAHPTEPVVCHSLTSNGQFDARGVLGLRRQTAEGVLKEHGCWSELWKVDGHLMPSDAVLFSSQVDLAVHDDVVTDVRIG